MAASGLQEKYSSKQDGQCIPFSDLILKSYYLISASFYRLQESQKPAQIQVERNRPISQGWRTKVTCGITYGLGGMAAIFGKCSLPHYKLCKSKFLICNRRVIIIYT